MTNSFLEEFALFTVPTFAAFRLWVIQQQPPQIAKYLAQELNFSPSLIPFDQRPDLLELRPVRLRPVMYANASTGYCYVELEINLDPYDVLYFQFNVDVDEEVASHFIFPSVTTSYAHLIPRKAKPCS